MTAVAYASGVSLHLPGTLAEALDLLNAKEESVAPLAGGTWVMRGSVRGDGFAPAYVLVGRLPELRDVSRRDGALVVGAAVTHAQLAEALDAEPGFAGLSRAAGASANPAVRRLATVGGNLATVGFAAGDLGPALLAISAEVELNDARGPRILPLAEYFAIRDTLPVGTLLTRIIVPVRKGVSVHERLTLRRAGDYPVAIVDVHAHLGAKGIVEAATVAVGSVEEVPRLWVSLGDRLVGSPLDPQAASDAARELSSELTPRDAVEAAGWYRLHVLPTLVGRAVRTLHDIGGQ